MDAAIPAAQDNQQRGALLQQLLELTDILLDGYKTELEAVRQATGESAQYHELKHRYEMDRRAYIQPFGKFFFGIFFNLTLMCQCFAQRYHMTRYLGILA